MKSGIVSGGLASSRYDAVMRTTIDLPDSLHGELRRMAYERRTSLSKVALELIEVGLGQNSLVESEFDSALGIRTVRFGRGPILDRDVRAGDDEW